jgi:Flp pilus assembly protein TadG
MTQVRDRPGPEAGLVGKLLIVWLLVAALVVVAAIDTGTILLARYRAANAAQDASFQAASVYHETKDRRKATEAALASIEEKDGGAKLAALAIDPATGKVTVTVKDHVSTLIAGRLDFTEGFTRVTVQDTSEPPTL